MEVDRFFNGYGRLTLILMRKRHSFVFIQERRDAEDAVKELKGRKVRGENITLELLEKGSLRNFSEFPRYRLKVENISQNTASTELRDYMKQVSVQLLKSSSDHDIEAGEVLEKDDRKLVDEETKKLNNRKAAFDELRVSTVIDSCVFWN